MRACFDSCLDRVHSDGAVSAFRLPSSACLSARVEPARRVPRQPRRQNTDTWTPHFAATHEKHRAGWTGRRRSSCLRV
jgi:hypothetical protein